MNAGDLDKNDQHDQERINKLTNALKHILVSAEDIVIAVRTIGNSTSDFRNSIYSQFWSEQVISNLVKILTDDVKLRSLIANILSSIRNLSICIQEGANTIKLNKGSRGSIAVAERTMSAALNVLEDCIKEASTLDDTAVARVANEMKELQGMIISEAANFDTQKAEINTRIEECHREREEFNAKLQSQTGKLEHLSKLIRGMEQLIEDTKKYLELIKNSTDEMIVQNENDQRRIQSIPDTIEKFVKEKCNCRIFCHRSHKYTVTESNSKGILHKNQLKDKVAQRKMKIQKNTNNQTEQKKYLISLENQLGAYKSEHKTVQNKIQDCKNRYEAKMQTIQNNIDMLRQNFIDVENAAAAFRREIGPTVTENLTQVATLNESLHHENSIGSQIVSLLKAVKGPVQDCLTWLTSGNEESVYHATKRLLKQASFLASYSASANTLLQPTPKYSALTTAT